MQQLTSLGLQDGYLTVRAEMTFFKASYLHYTNFSMEMVTQSWSSGQNGAGQLMYIDIPRSADLIGQIFVKFKTPAIMHPGGQQAGVVHWVNSFGHAIIDYTSMEIGTHEIDRIWGEFMEILEEVTAKPGKELNEMIGKRMTTAALVDDASRARNYYTPMKFWFNSNPRYYLPLNALQFHQVRLNMRTRPLRDLWINETDALAPVKTDGTALLASDITAEVLINYIFLDVYERRLFALSTHEYLIRTCQFNNGESVEGSANTNAVKQISLPFNHPVAELFWVIQQDAYVTNNVNEWFNWEGVNGLDPLHSAEMQFNNQTRFQRQDGDFFRLVEPWMHNTRIPAKHVYVYSFALYPEDVTQPSGSLNFSRIDTPKMTCYLQAGLGRCTARFYCTQMNVLRILGGMGGKAFSS